MPPNPDPPNATSRPQDTARHGPAVPPPEHPLSELAAAFNFSPDVLPANRAGHVTDQQAADMAAGTKKLAGCLFLLGLPVFVLIGSSPFWAFSPTGRSAQAQFLVLFCAFWALAFVMFVIVLAWLALRPHDYRSEPVLTAAGIVSKKTLTGRRVEGNPSVYIIRVGQEEWTFGYPIGKPYYDALTEGAAYRVYYTRKHQILSVEPG